MGFKPIIAKIITFLCKPVGVLNVLKNLTFYGTTLSANMLTLDGSFTLKTHCSGKLLEYRNPSQFSNLVSDHGKSRMAAKMSPPPSVKRLFLLYFIKLNLNTPHFSGFCTPFGYFLEVIRKHL